MSELIYINPAKINPKTREDIRTAEIKKLLAMKAEGKTIIGLEMTVTELAELCDKNIDPQHTDKRINQSCAREIATNAETLLSAYRDKKDVICVTNRVDVDSVASYILATRFLNGKELIYTPTIAEINSHDTFQRTPWSGPKPIEEMFNPENKVGALASSIKVFMVTPANIQNVANFIDYETVPEEIQNSYRQTQLSIINNVRNGKTVIEAKDGIAVVSTPSSCATALCYSKAPVGIAENNNMRGADGTFYRKISIFQHEAGYIDLGKALEKLNARENGWGGSPTFIGSKQGENCTIETAEIVKIAQECLTPEYRRQITGNSFLINIGQTR